MIAYPIVLHNEHLLQHIIVLTNENKIARTCVDRIENDHPQINQLRQKSS